MTVDPIVSRSLVALAAGVVLILVGLILDPPLALLGRWASSRID